jgi:hypothetical protein
LKTSAIATVQSAIAFVGIQQRPQMRLAEDQRARTMASGDIIIRAVIDSSGENRLVKESVTVNERNARK